MKKLFLLTLLVSFVGCDIISSDDDKSALVYNKKEEAKKDPIEVKPEGPKKPDEVDPDSINDPYYAFIKAEVFVKNCTECHNPKGAEERNRIDLTDKEVVKREFDIVVERMLRDPNARGFMPPKRTGLPPVREELIKVMRMWKEKGF